MDKNVESFLEHRLRCFFYFLVQLCPSGVDGSLAYARLRMMTPLPKQLYSLCCGGGGFCFSMAFSIAVFLVVISGQTTTYCGGMGDWSRTGVFLKNANRHKKSPKTEVFGDKSYRF